MRVAPIAVAYFLALSALAACTAAPINSTTSVSIPDKVKVPALVGMAGKDVDSVLLQADLAMGIALEPGSPDPASGVTDWVVTAQSIPAGTEVERGRKVIVTVRVALDTATPTPSLSPAPQPVPMITYKVWGDGTEASSVSYTKPDGTFSIAQVTHARLPWSVTLPLTGESPHALVAQSGNGSSISCSISVDGGTPIENTSSGSYAVVTCG